jgi:succinyl-diaminopimelate desuccinylase
MSKVVDLACELIRRSSITPDDGGIQAFLGSMFLAEGFSVEHLDFGDVKNLWVTHGRGAPLVMFNGHCDVVPAGPLESWQTVPFTPTVDGGNLYGRGAADMKGSLAALCVALLDFVRANPDHIGTVALLVTSDEEGNAIDGTRRALEVLLERGKKFDFVLVGEPTSDHSFGDMIKVGRRGSISAKMTVFGKQGHVAYPHLADNPVHRLAPFLTELLAIRWDGGNKNFPPTSLQVSNIHAGTGATNVVPGTVVLDFNLRYNTELTADFIQNRVTKMAGAYKLECEFVWNASAQPFLTRDRDLISTVAQAIFKETGNRPQEGTGGGTSDARFFAMHNIPVVEFGPSNATIHAANECVGVEEIESCARIYKAVLESLLK